MTTRNGEVTDSKEIASEVLDEGESAVVVKGVLGLPDDENWETYEGDPVANDGGDVIITAQQYIGKVRYKRGGTSLTTGVDCVGFVRAIYRLYGLDLPSSLGRQGRGVSYSEAKPGDIIIYPKHVGIYIGDGKMVHATSVSGVSVDKVNTKKLSGVRRVID